MNECNINGLNELSEEEFSIEIVPDTPSGGIKNNQTLEELGYSFEVGV